MKTDAIEHQRRTVIDLLRANGGVATPAEAERMCDAVPNGHAAMERLVECGAILSDQCDNLHVRESATVIVDGHAVRF